MALKVTANGQSTGQELFIAVQPAN